MTNVLYKSFPCPFEKAKKGTPQYDEWLRKYLEKRGKKIESSESIPTSSEPSKKSYPSYLKDELISKPPKIAQNKEIWEKAVNKVTNNGTKEAGYGAAIALYKLKLRKL